MSRSPLHVQSLPSWKAPLFQKPHPLQDAHLTPVNTHKDYEYPSEWAILSLMRIFFPGGSGKTK